MIADFWERYLERQKLRLVLGVIILFLISMFQSCQELRYMAFGKTTDATLTSHVERLQRNGEAYQKRVITFTYDDNGERRQHSQDVDMDWPGAQSSSVKIQYISGNEINSRLAGEHNYGWVTVFFVSLILSIGGVYLLSRDG